MTSNQIFELLKFYGWYFGGCATAVLTIRAWLKTEEIKSRDKARENSVGAERLKQIEDANLIVKQDIKQLKSDNHSQQQQIQKLDHDYDKLIDRVLEFFGKK